MDDLSIPAVADEERARVLASLALGFAADPLMRWLFPTGGDYLEATTGEFYNAFGGGAIEHRTAYRTAAFEGAALWYPPGEGEYGTHDGVSYYFCVTTVYRNAGESFIGQAVITPAGRAIGVS